MIKTSGGVRLHPSLPRACIQPPHQDMPQKPMVVRDGPMPAAGI
jgi:hypothetical protein